jgi:2-keto-4-pentenoate hydratase/2-oxohepta-3-ene-1,7-dioic acid hydratase in catechol pathway
MKLISYSDATIEAGVGVLIDDVSFADLTRAGISSCMIDVIERFDALGTVIAAVVAERKFVRPLSEVRVEAPIPAPRRNLFCVGKNYIEHAAEFGSSGFDAGATGGNEIPEYPIIFSKPGSVVIGPGKTIDSSLDPYASVDYEGELAVVLGRNGRVTSEHDPMSFVFGYTIFNDVTSRELQKRHKQWLLGKGIDTFGPLGPAIVTVDELHDLKSLGIRTWVNDEIRQSAKIGDLIFDVATLIRTIGHSIAFRAGDIIATGTPVGVGIGFNPPKYLHPGDKVRIEIDGVGTLENLVA